MDLPNGSHTRTDCHNAVERHNGAIDAPSPPSVRFSHLKPHNDWKNEVHWDESNSAYQGNKVTKEWNQSCQESNDYIVDQGHGESDC